MLTISDKCKHIYRNLQYIHIAFNNNLLLFHTRKALHTDTGQIGHEADYSVTFQSSIRRVAVEKLTPILKSFLGSLTKGLA